MNQALERQPLTDLLLRKLKGGEERIDSPASASRVAPSGTKSFVLPYRFAVSRAVSRSAGIPYLGLAEAREIAKDALNQAARGIDPRQGKEVSPKSHVFEDVVEVFVRLHCERRNRKRTREETERILRTNFVSRWKSRDVRDISRNDILDVLDSIVERGSCFLFLTF